MFGLGLRPRVCGEAAAGRVRVDWFELISENFMVSGGNPLRVLDAVRSRYPVALHGVSMNLGGTDPLDLAYLDELAQLARRAEPLWISDHLCWTRHGGHHLHDLLPLPFTGEAVDHVAARVRQVQDRLGRQILIENVSSYAQLAKGTMQEWEFLVAVAERADCHILLDLNNIIVSAHNHGFDPASYLQAVPPARVRQFHLAGHSSSGALLIDTHDHPVPGEVFELYAQAVCRFAAVPAILERDDRIPPLDELLGELEGARRVCAQAVAA